MVPPAAFLFASVMVAMGALSRSFKEAQTLLTPVYFLCMTPSLIAALGDFPMNATTAAVPGVSLTLLARELVLGHAPARAGADHLRHHHRGRRGRDGAGGAPL